MKFKKLRYSFLLQRKFKNYLFYAFGETLLIVLGILIALQINDWHDRHKDRELAGSILKSILRDLEDDRQQLQQIIDLQVAKKETLTSILNSAASGDVGSSALARSLSNETLQLNPTFFPSIGAYRSASTSGTISAVKSQTLKQALTSLYGRYYEQLIHNGKLYDAWVDRVGWEGLKARALAAQQQAVSQAEPDPTEPPNAVPDTARPVYIDGTEVRYPLIAAAAKYLIAQNDIYSTRAQQTLDRIHRLEALIEQELGHLRQRE